MTGKRLRFWWFLICYFYRILARTRRTCCKMQVVLNWETCCYGVCMRGLFTLSWTESVIQPCTSFFFFLRPSLLLSLLLFPYGLDPLTLLPLRTKLTRWEASWNIAEQKASGMLYVCLRSWMTVFHWQWDMQCFSSAFWYPLSPRMVQHSHQAIFDWVHVSLQKSITTLGHQDCRRTAGIGCHTRIIVLLWSHSRQSN